MTVPATRPGLRRLLRDRRGNAMIEMAIAMPVLLYLALGIVDLTRGFAYRMALKQHAQTGADLVVASGMVVPTDTEIKSQIAAASGLPTSAVTIARLTQCNYQAPASFGNCADSSAVRVDYLKITVAGTFTPVVNTGLTAPFLPPGAMRAAVTLRLP